MMLMTRSLLLAASLHQTAVDWLAPTPLQIAIRLLKITVRHTTHVRQ